MRISGWLLCGMGLLTGLTTQATGAVSPPMVAKIIQHQFPMNRAELHTLTDNLFTEYQQQKNIASLIFYSYGMLKLADRFAAENDIIKASEYARSGFFYLDEAAELYENDPRVRYLRARVDAFLTATPGRCVIALSDTQFILNTAMKDDGDMLSHVQYMRYRALHNCGQFKQAAALLTQIKQTHPHLTSLSLALNAVPEWDAGEVTKIVLPLAWGK
ncbi:hypothetical protein COO59_01040 [Mixta theicola]|uniref:Uncharacterized protein n=1 Tax=Mixta theicola TaxID=1458355 RepID=A0A2K1QEH6_9GAMM|nr:hypothetical protein [Mixta theicola]PNS13430.1 hypothetical protein COO59_01040 [Mixta theicola]GLR09744.1 hypothetical protein GCM10007905_24640 [Mixta theicola]